MKQQNWFFLMRFMWCVLALLADHPDAKDAAQECMEDIEKAFRQADRDGQIDGDGQIRQRRLHWWEKLGHSL